MSPEIVAAIITSCVSCFGSILVVTIGLLTILLERQKIHTERERIKIDSERLQAELIKMGAETQKIRNETNEILKLKNEIQESKIEIDKERELVLINRRYAIYPEILELVYRIRNGLREFIELWKKGAEEELPFKNKKISFPTEEIYMLTENLYKYRAFIDDDAFQLLHRFKRVSQDAKMMDNVVFRPPITSEERKGKNDDEINSIVASRMKDRINNSIEDFENIYSEIDKLYSEITKRIKNFVEMVNQRE
jgi:hypothetical protein